MTVLSDLADDKCAKAACAAHGDRPDAALEILHRVQAQEGWISDRALRTIADRLNISRAEIHGIVTFYHDFRRSPPKTHEIQLCRAEACQAVGSEELAGEAEALVAGKDIAVKTVYCLGNCALGPAAMVDGKLCARMSRDKLAAMISEMKA